MLKHLDSKYLHSDSRAQAINDGVLINVSETARNASFTIPFVATDTAWHRWSKEDTDKQVYQDTDGRLWDILSMLRFAISKDHVTNYVLYKLYVVPRDGKTKKAVCTELKTVINGGDNGQPVITIMFPHED